ncbi:MAG: cell division protein FtsH [Candidatus Nealsonbacteria bacterium RIFOXYB1_FULL_40_15]|uniref:ATP-dependent zinc metalloprotease FtsH n=2 Tax=Candidatus Nealsoniibacteriota TaxID=1817911 RepID=A0A1G2EUW8_9BACT|nr:MAG: cell division protein FtsH [Candidatus Nealsonbacteria bacterium RIFOXYB1_FULL_40_15]OGZ29151.1 MAG: cell division protein FtsH [Candidatus Nealsonbacteria bacterium RIFOXYC1_FULL_40_7]
MKFLLKNIVAILIIFVVISGIFALVFQPFSQAEEVSLNQLVSDINQSKVEKITAYGSELTIKYKDGKEMVSRKEPETGLRETLLSYGAGQQRIDQVNIDIKEEKEGASSWLIPLLIFGIAPLVLFGFFFWVILKQAKAGAAQTFSFTRARARLFGAEGHPKTKVTFKEVAGLKEAKEELKEIVDFLKNPNKYLKMGARIPKGVLLTGMPGTGKTLLARAVAGEADVPFFSISGSEFVEMFVGVGSARVKDLFSTAKKHQPAIIYIDELDAIGRHRGAGIGGGHDEREQTLNQILVEMDGFEQDSQIVVLSSTNRPDILDPALLRPGRFDRKVVLDMPDVEGREEILQIHCKGKPLSQDVNLREISERTPGFSGADVANIANEAAILAARRSKEQIWQEEFLESIDKVLLGPERKSHVLSKKEKKIAAYHEAGHALVSASLPGTEPIRKISIISRGMAAGYTLKTPSEEKRMMTKTEFMSEIATLLGGYTAERIVFGEITTGASNDLKKASDLARRLVKEYGMSSLGPISYGEKEELVFLGKEISEERNYSEKVASRIDDEVEKFIKQGQIQAEKTLSKRRKLLDKIADVLIEKETIEKEDFEGLMRGDPEKKKQDLKIDIKDVE